LFAAFLTRLLPFQISLTEWKRYTCDICGGKILNGEREWQIHYASRSHKKKVAGVHKRKRLEEHLATRKKTLNGGGANETFTENHEPYT